MKQLLWKLANRDEPIFYHWTIRKDGKMISILSTLFQDDRVSFWNGATLPEYRRMGLSLALRQQALRHAVSKGCKTGMSFLMSEGMAYGICTKLGYQTQWKFNAYVAPTNE